MFQRYKLSVSGHQTLVSPIAGNLSDLIRRTTLKNGYVFKGLGAASARNTEPPDNFTSAMHKGIAVQCNYNEKIYACADGIIQNTGTSNFEIKAEKLPYYNSTDTYSATILYENVRLLSGIENGTVVKKGQEIGRITNDRSCGEIGPAYYLHLKVAAYQKSEADPSGSNSNIDPLLLLGADSA